MTQSFTRSTGLVAVGQASVKLTQLVLAVVLVREFSAADWNETAFLLSIYLAAVAIGTLGLHHGIVFFLPRVGGDRQRALVMQSVGLLVGIGAAIAVGLTIAAPAISGGRLGDPGRIPWLGFAIALELPCACTSMALIGDRRFRGAASWDVGGAALVILATVTPVALGAGVNGVVAGLVVVGAIRLVATVVVVGRLFPGRLTGLPRGMWVKQVRYGLPLGVALTVTMLNRLVDKWFIALFDSGNFGIYSVAAQEVPLLAVLPYAGGAALVSAFVDAFHAGDVALARTHWIHLTSVMSFVVVPLAMVLVLTAPELVTILFTPAFSAGVVPFQLFTLVTLQRVAEYGMLLRAAGRNRTLLGVAAVTLGANAVLAGVGAYWGGIVGAALGTLIASVIGWVYVLHMVASVLEVRVREAFAWRDWSASVAIGAISVGAVRTAVVPFDAGSGSRLVLETVAFSAIYCFGVRVWRRSPRSIVDEAVVAPQRSTFDHPVPVGAEESRRTVA